MIETFLNPSPVVWPLAALLVVLLVLRQLRDGLQPVISATAKGLARHAEGNAQVYALAFGFGISASLTAFVDVFQGLNDEAIRALGWHQYFAIWAKVFSPFVVTLLAYLVNASRVQAKANGNGTTPPFSSTPKTP